MPKYSVIHGSVTVGTEHGKPVAAKVGDTIEMTEAQAKGLVASGFITDVETFEHLKQMIDSARRANALSGLDRKLSKLAAALAERAQAV